MSRRAISISIDRTLALERQASESGLALVITLMAMTLVLALGLALALTTTTESAIAAHYRTGAEAFYAADAAVEVAVHDLADEPDWSTIVDPAGPRLYRSGALAGVLPVGMTSRMNIEVWVSPGAGAGVLMIEGHAYGPDGARRVVEADVSRDGDGVQMLSWRDAVSRPPR